MRDNAGDCAQFIDFVARCKAALRNHLRSTGSSTSDDFYSKIAAEALLLNALEIRRLSKRLGGRLAYFHHLALAETP
jgi:hypothetical protein